MNFLSRSLKVPLLAIVMIMLCACNKTSSPENVQLIVKDIAETKALVEEIVLTRNADEYFFSESFKDLQEELGIVEEEGKTALFVFFDMQGCPYCLYMKEKVLNQIEVQDFYNQNFRSITIDIHASTEASDVDGTEMTEKTLAAKYGVDLTPTMIFFGTNGEELHRRIGILKTREELIIMAKEVLEFQSEN